MPLLNDKLLISHNTVVRENSTFRRLAFSHSCFHKHNSQNVQLKNPDSYLNNDNGSLILLRVCNGNFILSYM